MTTTSITINAGSGDCWGDVVGNFDSAGTTLFVGATDTGDRDPRTWIPFVVNLAKNTIVVSANLRLVGASTGAAVTSSIKTGCEAADNPSTPTNATNLYARAWSANTNVVTLAQYIAGAAYTYDVTAAVQEILNRAGWVKGNTLAVMIDDVDTADKPHYAAASSNGTYTGPQLEMVIRNFMPRGGDLF